MYVYMYDSQTIFSTGSITHTCTHTHSFCTNLLPSFFSPNILLNPFWELLELNLCWQATAKTEPYQAMFTLSASFVCVYPSFIFILWAVNPINSLTQQIAKPTLRGWDPGVREADSLLPTVREDRRGPHRHRVGEQPQHCWVFLTLAWSGCVCLAFPDSSLREGAGH